MAKPSNKNKTNKAPEAQELPVSANSEPEIVVAVIEEVEAAAPDVALIGAEQPAKNSEIQPSEDRKFPVTIRFDHGFWCPALQKSFMPGFYKAKDFKELKLLAPYGTVL